MSEEIESLFDSQTPKNQGEKTLEIESESSVIGVIFTVLAWLNLIVGLMLMIVEANESYYDSYAPAFTFVGTSLFLFAVASCLKFLAIISSRMGRIMRALEK